MSRLELPNGDWVDFAPRLNYAQSRRILGAQNTPDAAGTLVAALVVGWSLRDVEGEEIELPNVAVDGIPLDALDRVPFDVFQEMGMEASKIPVAEPDPKGTGRPLPGSARASRSRSTRTLPTPTSLPTIPDGPGMDFSERRRASSG